MTKRINLALDDTEYGIIEQLQKKYGGTLPQIIKDSVKFKYDKSFPPHTISTRVGKPITNEDVEEEPELSKAQICELRGGKLIKKDGKMFCEILKKNERTGGEMGKTILLDNLTEDDF